MWKWEWKLRVVRIWNTYSITNHNIECSQREERKLYDCSFIVFYLLLFSCCSEADTYIQWASAYRRCPDVSAVGGETLEAVDLPNNQHDRMRYSCLLFYATTVQSHLYLISLLRSSRRVNQRESSTTSLLFTNLPLSPLHSKVSMAHPFSCGDITQGRLTARKHYLIKPTFVVLVEK